MAAHRMWGTNYVIFRPHNVYGEYQNIGDPYRNVVGIFMNQILQGRPMTIFGDGTQTRAFSYIDDVAPVLADAIGTGAACNLVFNFGADRATTLNELAAQVAAAMGVAPQVVHLDARHEVAHAHSDHTRLAAVFGRRQTVPLEEGLQRMAGWVKRHGARATPSFTGIEVSKNLPTAWRDP